jgi:hypothetical protein
MTSKLAVAVATGKKVFAPFTWAEVISQAADPGLRMFKGDTDRLRSPITRMQYIDGVEVQRYLNMILNHPGEPIPKILHERVTDKIRTETFQQSMREYELAMEMRDMVSLGGITAVVAYEDGVLTCPVVGSELSTEITFTLTSKLSEKIQNNIAVLQLMKDGELARYVGFKSSSTCMFIVV